MDDTTQQDGSDSDPDAEVELDKQYKEYKAQFEQWKESNKGSIGSQPYNDYVKQFEDWERDVEKRRKIIREKAERESFEVRVKAEDEEREKAAMKVKEAEAAEAYLLSQQQYLAHHQAAMESEMRPANYQVSAQPQTYAVQTAQQKPDLSQEALLREVRTAMGSSSMTNAPAVSQQPPPSQQTSMATPDLWGSNKIKYDPSDPLFLRWGPRAAPAHLPPPPRLNQMPTACWMLLEELKDKKKILAPHTSLPPPPIFQPPPTTN